MTDYDENGNGLTQPRSRVTLLEIAVGVVREQIKQLSATLNAHVADPRWDDHEWREKIEEEVSAIKLAIQAADPTRGWKILEDHTNKLAEIQRRHDREDYERNWITENWRTVGGVVTFGATLLEAMHLWLKLF